jgi:hypothetical protein
MAPAVNVSFLYSHLFKGVLDHLSNGRVGCISNGKATTKTMEYCNVVSMVSDNQAYTGNYLTWTDIYTSLPDTHISTTITASRSIEVWIQLNYLSSLKSTRTKSLIPNKYFVTSCQKHAELYTACVIQT